MVKVIKLDNTDSKVKAVLLSADILAKSGVIIFPTDTVYGIAAKQDDKEAINKIYMLKSRDFKKPLALLVADEKIVYNLSDNVPAKAATFMKTFWPGALTIILTQKNGQTLGFRMPDNETALEIIKASGGCLAVTSVNKSGETEATETSEIDKSILSGADLLVDGGKCLLQKPSTVLIFDINGNYKILRSGSVTEAQLKEYC